MNRILRKIRRKIRYGLQRARFQVALIALADFNVPFCNDGWVPGETIREALSDIAANVRDGDFGHALDELRAALKGEIDAYYEGRPFPVAVAFARAEALARVEYWTVLFVKWLSQKGFTARRVADDVGDNYGYVKCYEDEDYEGPIAFHLGHRAQERDEAPAPAPVDPPMRESAPSNGVGLQSQPLVKGVEW